MGIDSTRIIQCAFVVSGILAGIAGDALRTDQQEDQHDGKDCDGGISGTQHGQQQGLHNA
ncbi:hypothetical protein, partial [Gemmiger formicilis]|uniref:hypothetical protein n=1 Tax=Gemmiger formicilis TaxID=745368 RepID=UPI001FAF1F8A